MKSAALADVLGIEDDPRRIIFNIKMQFALEGYQISSVNLQENWPISCHHNDLVTYMK